MHLGWFSAHRPLVLPGNVGFLDDRPTGAGDLSDGSENEWVRRLLRGPLCTATGGEFALSSKFLRL